ncbi:esterase [Pseudomonas sp. LB-090624]|uniref:alpha/beta hydrolase n=1 Tax=Pseudomonas sp. LB-090624 TaxID=2213079 RepID=UPI000D861721|nr:alpha/beta hydrolase [Pseudomonas sp. LB-090624]PYB78827.1 esterase [Pseudomonas sp. LB-090624]
MTHYELAPNLAAYVAASATFRAENETLECKRAAFARACRHFTEQAPVNVTFFDDAVDACAVRIYLPVSEAPAGGWPTLLYIHGGGWNLGSHTTHDWFAFALLKRLQVAIVAIDYRLAPEHPFPAPLDDALTVWRALRDGKWPVLSQERLMVAGDSAGGTIAAGLCIALRDHAMDQPLLQVLVYPVLTDSVQLPSMQQHAHAPMLTTAGLLTSLEGYVPEPSHRHLPQALPLNTQDPSGLAPAFIGVAEYDPLCDQGKEYAALLQAAGIPTTLHLGQGLVHASLRAKGVEQVELFYDAIAEAVQRAI